MEYVGLLTVAIQTRCFSCPWVTDPADADSGVLAGWGVLPGTWDIGTLVILAKRVFQKNKKCFVIFLRVLAFPLLLSEIRSGEFCCVSFCTFKRLNVTDPGQSSVSLFAHSNMLERVQCDLTLF